MGKALKDVFNWLAEKPSQQYTLGGNRFSVKFNRAARIVERCVTIPAVAVGIGIAAFGLPVAVAGAPVGAAGALAVGFAFAAMGKADGMIKGAITHLVAKGASALVNRLAKPKAPAPQQG